MVKDGDREIPYGYCHCGCGQKTRIATVNDKGNGTVKGEPKRYVNHHYNKGRHRDLIKDGYILVYCPSHPRSRKNGYVPEHVLVAEKVIGRPLKPGEVPHHKDGNRGNNSPDNIEVFESNGKHISFHAQISETWGAGNGPRKDYDAAVLLYTEHGWTVAQLAKKFGMSRWGMHKILTIRGCKFRGKVSGAGRKAE